MVGACSLNGRDDRYTQSFYLKT